MSTHSSLYPDSDHSSASRTPRARRPKRIPLTFGSGGRLSSQESLTRTRNPVDHSPLPVTIFPTHRRTHPCSPSPMEQQQQPNMEQVMQMLQELRADNVT